MSTSSSAILLANPLDSRSLSSSPSRALLSRMSYDTSAADVSQQLSTPLTQRSMMSSTLLSKTLPKITTQVIERDRYSSERENKSPLQPLQQQQQPQTTTSSGTAPSTMDHLQTKSFIRDINAEDVSPVVSMEEFTEEENTTSVKKTKASVPMQSTFNKPATAVRPASSPALATSSYTAASSSPSSLTSSTVPSSSHPFTHSLELVGEHNPLYLGDSDITLADKYIKDEGCHKLVHELLGRGEKMKVVSLDLRGNDIRRYGAEAISKLLSHDDSTSGSTSLETLNLEWNFLGDCGGSGLEILCDSLKVNRSLTTLDLRNNRLNSECGLSLGRLLLSNTTLKYLDLRWNNLSASGGESILAALTRNHYIYSIQLSGNRIPTSILRAIEEICQKNRDVGLKAGKEVKSERDIHRVLELEQLIHDLRTDNERALQRNMKLETELKEEEHKADSLQETLGRTTDQFTLHKEHSAKSIAFLTQSLEVAQSSLHESLRAHDQSKFELKQTTSDLLSTQAELRLIQEDRSRLLLSRESTIQSMNQQIEKLHAEISSLTELQHSRDRLHNEAREQHTDEMKQMKKRMEDEKDQSVRDLQDRIRVLNMETLKQKDDYSFQLTDLQTKYKSSQNHLSEQTQLVLALREQLIQQGIVHEEAMSRMDSTRLHAINEAHAKILGEFKDKLGGLEKARDDLARENEKAMEQLTRERNQHIAALESERLRHSSAIKQASESQQELFHLRTKCAEVEHANSVLTSSLTASQQALESQQRRHAEQIEIVYAQSNTELESTQKALRRVEEEKAKLHVKMKQLEGELAGIRAEQQIRSANLATALSAIKSSISVVDENVNTTSHLARSSGGHHHHHTSEHKHRDHESSSSHHHSHAHADSSARRHHSSSTPAASHQHRSEREHRDEKESSHHHSSSSHARPDSHRSHSHEQHSHRDRERERDASHSTRRHSSSHRDHDAAGGHSALSSARQSQVGSPDLRSRHASRPSSAQKSGTEHAAEALQQRAAATAGQQQRSTLDVNARSAVRINPLPLAALQHASTPTPAPAAAPVRTTQSQPQQLAPSQLSQQQRRHAMLPASRDDESNVSISLSHDQLHAQQDADVDYEDEHEKSVQEEQEGTPEISFEE